MPRLISINFDPPINFEFVKDSITIGRAPDNDLVINDILVSRRHCTIYQDAGKWKIMDNNSLNGVYVNNLRVSDEFLASGDQIGLGNVKLVFEDVTLYMSETSSAKEAPSALQEFVKPVSLVKNELGLGQEFSPGSSLISEKPLVASESFFILYQIVRALNSANSLDELLHLTMSLIFQVIRAERGVILLLNDKGELEQRLSMKRDNKESGEQIEIPVSKTIARRAISERAGIITSDAKYDPRFLQGASIIAYNIRSALCVPIWEKDRIRGVIYLDNLMQSYAFNEDDLNLLTAIANQVGVALRHDELQKRMQEEAIFRANLARFHSPDVVNQVIQQSKEQGKLSQSAVEREVTILFADICGFTALSETLGAQEMARLLVDYFSAMSDTIFAFKGTVDKFIGDAIMAIFGAPISYGNDAELAVYAAKAMLKRMEDFRRSVDEKKRFGIRIGINTGMVVAGYLGSSQRIEYTVIGDAVNIASRLQDLAQPNTIYIGEETYNRIKGTFPVKELGSVNLKGKKHSIKVYKVLTEEDLPS